jgi:hypothetical protein
MGPSPHTNPEEPKTTPSAKRDLGLFEVVKSLGVWGTLAGALAAILTLVGLVWVGLTVANKTLESVNKSIERAQEATEKLHDEVATGKAAVKTQQTEADKLKTDFEKLKTQTEGLNALAESVMGNKQHLIDVIQELNRSDTAKTFIDKMTKQDESPTGSGSTANGYLRVGDMLVCWGRKKLSNPPPPPQEPGKDTSNGRVFEFTFAQEFAGTPTVANAILVKSAGHSFAVFNHEISSTRYFGLVNHPRNAFTSDPVIFEYIAIGRAKQ